VCAALAAMSTGIASATDVIASGTLEDQKGRLDGRIAALQALTGLVPSLMDAGHIACDDPYLAVASTVELFRLLVAECAVKASATLQTSAAGTEAGLSHPDVLAAAARP